MWEDHVYGDHTKCDEWDECVLARKWTFNDLYTHFYFDKDVPGEHIFTNAPLILMWGEYVNTQTSYDKSQLLATGANQNEQQSLWAIPDMYMDEWFEFRNRNYHDKEYLLDNGWELGNLPQDVISHAQAKLVAILFCSLSKSRLGMILPPELILEIARYASDHEEDVSVPTFLIEKYRNYPKMGTGL